MSQKGKELYIGFYKGQSLGNTLCGFREMQRTISKKLVSKISNFFWAESRKIMSEIPFDPQKPFKISFTFFRAMFIRK